MISSNTTSRSPSRSANRQSQSSTPGVLAISSAMLANANQSQNGQSKTFGKRSKSTNQRRSQNASSTSLFDPSAPTDSPTTAANKAETRPEPASALTAMMTSHSASDEVASSPANSPSKRTRSRRRAKPAPSASDADEVAAHSEDPAAAQSLAPASKASRPRHPRGISAINLVDTSTSQNDDQSIDSPSLTPGQQDTASLSKSAPASSFLESLQHSSKRRGKQNPSSRDTPPSSKAPIRGSNSADEWEMPSARLITGGDTLTWQQQAALTRKSSQQSKKNPKNIDTLTSKKQHPSTASQSASPAGTTVPSGLSNAMAIGAANSHTSAQSSPALTWQQALLQRSTPATPSSGNIFEALEDGYSGARPASDHHRTRSSPVKNSRPFTRSQQQIATGKSVAANNKDVIDLDKQLNDLVLSSVKPSTATQPKSAKKVKPIPISPSTYTREERAQNSDSDKIQTPAGTSPSVTKPVPLASSSSSPSKSALYAGPKFHNSPHAAQLPTPRLAAFLNRNRESSPVAQSPSTTEAIFA